MNDWWELLAVYAVAGVAWSLLAVLAAKALTRWGRRR